MTVIMPFGKYRDKSLTDVYRSDPSYLAWLLCNVEGWDDIKAMIEELPDMEAHLTAYQSRQRHREWKKGRFSSSTVDKTCERLFNGE